MTSPAQRARERKPHKAWDCPCTPCQVWYKQALGRRDALLREALQYLDMGKWSDLKARIESELKG